MFKNVLLCTKLLHKNVVFVNYLISAIHKPLTLSSRCINKHLTLNTNRKV